MKDRLVAFGGEGSIQATADTETIRTDDRWEADYYEAGIQLEQDGGFVIDERSGQSLKIDFDFDREGSKALANRFFTAVADYLHEDDTRYDSSVHHHLDVKTRRETTLRRDDVDAAISGSGTKWIDNTTLSGNANASAGGSIEGHSIVGEAPSQCDADNPYGDDYDPYGDDYDPDSGQSGSGCGGSDSSYYWEDLFNYRDWTSSADESFLIGGGNYSQGLVFNEQGGWEGVGPEYETSDSYSGTYNETMPMDYSSGGYVDGEWTVDDAGGPTAHLSQDINGSRALTGMPDDAYTDFDFVNFDGGYKTPLPVLGQTHNPETDFLEALGDTDYRYLPSTETMPAGEVVDRLAVGLVQSACTDRSGIGIGPLGDRREGRCHEFRALRSPRLCVEVF